MSADGPTTQPPELQAAGERFRLGSAALIRARLYSSAAPTP